MTTEAPQPAAAAPAAAAHPRLQATPLGHLHSADLTGDPVDDPVDQVDPVDDPVDGPAVDGPVADTLPAGRYAPSA